MFRKIAIVAVAMLSANQVNASLDGSYSEHKARMAVAADKRKKAQQKKKKAAKKAQMDQMSMAEFL